MNSTPQSGRPRVPGSERKALAGATPKGPVSGGEQLTVTVLVRRLAELPEVSGASALERSEFAAKYGADPADISKVEGFAKDAGLDVRDVSLAARTLTLSGTVDAFTKSFGVELRYYERSGTRYRGREDAIAIPPELDGIVVGVFGLDDRPQAKPHFRRNEAPGAGAQTFKPTQVAELYGFGSEASGEGQCIGLIELGGGYQQENLEHFFRGLEMEPPTVVPVEVGGATNNFAEGGGANVEVALDIQVAGALAPKATIAVYFAPNTDQGFLAAINEAVHDSTNKPSAISISWGDAEANWTSQAMTAMDEAFADAAALGISVFAASGDHGSADRPPFEESQGSGQPEKPNPEYDGKAHANFPASSPHAIACGGTHLTAAGKAVAAETAWNDGNGWATGGGVSDFFSVPAWQQGAQIPKSVNPPGQHEGRGVPDVAGNADNETGYQIYCGGEEIVVGGTSAVAPLWAGITARLNQGSGRKLGFLNTVLYTPAARSSLREVTNGDNAIPAIGGQPATPGYDAAQGWNACTGLGTPVGAALRALFA